MSGTADGLFGIHTQALQLWQRRAEAIADNLANADTPGYEARDIDFRKALSQAQADDSDGVRLAADQPGMIADNSVTGAGADAPLAYRVPTQPTMDGNTVDTQIEQAAYAQNTVHYQASLNFINGYIQTLRLAINGGN
ncbi:flagellar basal body rod protein FlgB [Oleiagrimonas sp. C23AA]|uniref:flagellar basal body rod protein FlgB n=1 Tax=Oleiagrimonas sp. C23AA TaxID=2719047 RepID=UPI00141F0F44|nr:flagellar basal body rod protein FlgB [Oleiagrimonas sp. C23AA]NII09214.1 flagellar basal body rod protein FlgB [Oleiagrimonas sp. C23AA]